MNNSKVWVYQSNRILSEEEKKFIQINLNEFVQNWKSHGSPLEGSGMVYLDRFIILMVNYASGCSIDQSVQFIKSLGNEINVDFFDRMLITYLNKKGDPRTVHLSEIEDLFHKNEIDEETYFFDALVNTKEQYETSFKKKIGESWLKSRLN
jgi:hypothetical protein